MSCMGIVHPAAKAEFFFVEAGEIVLRGVLHGVVVGKISLQHDFAWDFSAAGSAGNLGEQLKGALGGTEIREAECVVCAYHAHQGHTVDVVAFGDHLSANQQVQFTRVQSVEGALEVGVAANCIAIQAGDSRLRKQSVQQLF